MQYIGPDIAGGRAAGRAHRARRFGGIRPIILGLGHSRLFGQFVRRFGARFDRVVYRATSGRFSPTGIVAPVLLLTTTGRRSGRERTVPVMYIPDGDNYVVSSEDVGQSRPAAWPLNLDANPAARVQVGRTNISCRARRLSDAEADTYWARLLEMWPAHDTYRKRSGTRHTFILKPQS